jgi:K(+)-stimulated pyrophosphate-energized sodium pump
MAPIAVGFGLGASALAGYLAGAIAAGTLMAVFLANSGGAWDNAKKLVEDGHHGGKGSDAHAATVIGDTVGDPFKDTAGPAINPLIKVMNLVSLLIAPAVVAMSPLSTTPSAWRYAIAGVAVVVIVVAVTISTRRNVAIANDPDDVVLESGSSASERELPALQPRPAEQAKAEPVRNLDQPRSAEKLRPTEPVLPNHRPELRK